VTVARDDGRDELAPPDPRGADRAADRRSFLWFAGFAALFLGVNTVTTTIEFGRDGVSRMGAEVFLWELTSFLVIVPLFFLVVAAVRLALPGQSSWRRILAVHIPAALLFSLLHVVGMVALRKGLYPLIASAPYRFTDAPLRDFFYEAQKDTLTYLIILVFIVFGRQLAETRAALAAARAEAQATRRLRFKSGGTTLYVEPETVRWAKAAGNYVELAAGGRTMLIRATLASVEAQLQAAGADILRIHRSYLVSRAAIEKTRPNGEGDLVVTLTDGTEIPASRRYRGALDTSG
jgi:hypothetical protein